MEGISKYIRDLNINIKKTIDRYDDPKKYLNFTQFQIIRYLLKHENDDVCQKDLEIETKLKKASITGTLDNLEDKGFIKRVQAKEDKRKNYIVVTQKVENFKKDFEKRIEEVDKNIIRNISKEELDVFIKVMNKMNENLEKEK